MELSIVLPAKNEADNVQPLLGEIHAALADSLEYEVIYVDDGSRDGTWATLRNLRNEGDRRLRILQHDQCCGQSAAILTGVRAARAAWVATLDADGQNDPADIPRLWARKRELGEPPALIAGRRVRRQDNWMKREASTIANAARSRILRDATLDTGCGLKLFPREIFLSLPWFDHMHRFLPALVQRAGGAVATVDVHHRPRLRGRTNYGIHNRLWVGIVDVLGVYWLQRRMRLPRVTEDQE